MDDWHMHLLPPPLHLLHPPHLHSLIQSLSRSSFRPLNLHLSENRSCLCVCLGHLGRTLTVEGMLFVLAVSIAMIHCHLCLEVSPQAFVWIQDELLHELCCHFFPNHLLQNRPRKQLSIVHHTTTVGGMA